MLRDISLKVAEGEFLTILGESGSGKTTLLRIIAGFETASSGEIWMDGERLDLLPPITARVNTVFQHYALFPHLTVEENVGYGLRVERQKQTEIAARVEQALAKVKMTAHAKAKPSKISGGQQQRVALARALVKRPRLLLLDEPLSALDANLRRQMQVELKSLQREVGISFVFVTHDQEEAMVMSDRMRFAPDGRTGAGGLAARDLQPPGDGLHGAVHRTHESAARGRASSGVLHCNSLAWKTSLADGPALFSLASGKYSAGPEIGTERSNESVRRSRQNFRSQAFHGATELLQVECADGLSFRCERPIGRTVQGRSNWNSIRPMQSRFANQRREPSMFSRAYRAAMTVPPLMWVVVFLLVPYCADVLLQLLVGFAVANHRAFLELRQLSRTGSPARFTGKRYCARCGLPPRHDCFRCCWDIRWPISFRSMRAREKICITNW